MSLLKSLAILFSISIFSLHGKAEDYSFRFFQVDSPGGYSEDQKVSKAMGCHIAENLREHTQFVRTELFPRISKELKLLLIPQRTRKGDSIQVAEAIDYADLHHVHLRTPVMEIPQDHKIGLIPEFVSQDSQHLQYHSFERVDNLFMMPKWLSELESTGNKKVVDWVHSVREYRNKKRPDPMMGGSYEVEPFDLLPEADRNLFVEIWFAHQFSDTSLENSDWVKLRLSEKIRMLDPGEAFYNYKALYRDRSVVSTLNLFSIIHPINIKGYIQPATIYFEERIDSAGVDLVIEKAKALGLHYIINSSDKTFDRSSFPKDTPWELHQMLADELRVAANQEGEFYTFKHSLSLESDYSYGQNFVFGWDDQYLFSIQYFLQCS